MAFGRNQGWAQIEHNFFEVPNTGLGVTEWLRDPLGILTARLEHGCDTIPAS